jgi:XTP/dITP diphosphohydrolase
MINEIIFVTGNESKVRHANEAVANLGFIFKGKRLDIIEPRDEEPEKIVVEKAIQAFNILKKPLVVEDSGIFIEALNGFPKTFVHFAQDTIGIKGILKLLEGTRNRKAEFRQSLAYIDEDNKRPKVFNYIDGGYKVADKIWKSLYSHDGEFDKILIPPGQTKPLCRFTKEWRAKRDVEANKETIHYKQLIVWLQSKDK